MRRELVSPLFVGRETELATMTTAIIKVSVLITAARATRRVERLVERIEHELAPTFGHINAIGRDASRCRFNN